MATHIERIDRRTRPVLYVAIVTFALTIVALGAAVVATYVAYDRQQSRVAEVEAENRRIEQDHVAIGARFAEQSAALEAAVRRAQEAYSQGVADGKRLKALPARFSPLEEFATDGFLVPRFVPGPLQSARSVIRKQEDGYTVRWPRVALFASSRDPLSQWTRQAWPGSLRTVKVGGRKVTRLLGPSGVVYAWRAERRTYAVLSYPKADRSARLLLAAMA